MICFNAGLALDCLCSKIKEKRTVWLYIAIIHQNYFGVLWVRCIWGAILRWDTHLYFDQNCFGSLCWVSLACDRSSVLRILTTQVKQISSRANCAAEVLELLAGAVLNTFWSLNSSYTLFSYFRYLHCEILWWRSSDSQKHSCQSFFQRSGKYGACAASVFLNEQFRWLDLVNYIMVKLMKNLYC